MLTQTRSVLGRDPRSLHGLGKSDRKGVKGGLFWENWKFRVEFVGEEMLRRGSGDGSHQGRRSVSGLRRTDILRGNVHCFCTHTWMEVPRRKSSPGPKVDERLYETYL